MTSSFNRRAGIFLLVVGIACAGKDKDDAAAADTTKATVGARTVLVAAQPFTETIGATGTVTPRAGHVASLAAPIAARVARVLVTAGQHVSVGQALVELDQAAIQAAAQSAEATLEAARLAHERAQRLATEGIVPRKDVEQAAAELAKARADVVGARRTAQLATLHAPIAGVVTRMTAVIGATADPAVPLVEIADPSALDVLLTMTPTDAARIHVGSRVTLTTGPSSATETLGVGTVADIAGTVDSASRGVAVRVQAPRASRPLRIGETVSGQVVVASDASALTVPIEALVPDGEGFKVFVVDSSGIAHARPVTVGARTDKVARIDDGLTAGERVVTYGAYGVEDSAKVVSVGTQATP